MANWYCYPHRFSKIWIKPVFFLMKKTSLKSIIIKRKKSDPYFIWQYKNLYICMRKKIMDKKGSIPEHCCFNQQNLLNWSNNNTRQDYIDTVYLIDRLFYPVYISLIFYNIGLECQNKSTRLLNYCLRTTLSVIFFFSSSRILFKIFLLVYLFFR
jgi:hypothetical protein